MIYFVSGHRDLTEEEFNKYYIPKIKDAIWNDKNARFVVADCEGCDTMFINYMLDNYPEANVTIFILDLSKYKGLFPFTLYVCKSILERDIRMTEESNKDIAFIRKGKENSYTALNILRRNTML